MDEGTTPQPGRHYKHFKGGLYQVVCMATDEETGRQMVVYRSLVDERVWCRPLAVWRQEVSWIAVDGRRHQEPRFVEVEG